MRIGVVIGRTGGSGDTVAGLAADYRRASDEDLSSVWLTQSLGFDALTLMASWGTNGGPELGTAVIPAQTLHPVALAEQALTTQALVAGRLTLGIGLAHAQTLQSRFGLSPVRSVQYLADYLTLLQALMSGELSAPNETFSISTQILSQHPSAPQVLIAALGPRTLQLVGEQTSGTITWMTGIRTIASHVVPSIQAAADAAGRVEPRVVACLPFCVTEEPDEARSRLSPLFAGYSQLPSYKAVLDREGVRHPVDVAVVGNDDYVQTTLEALRSAGATDVGVIPVGQPEEIEATWSLVGALARVSAR